MNQIAKLYGVNAQLGAQLRNGQQTTRILYDEETTDVTTESLEFFTNFGGKSNVQTNLKEGKLPSGESMVIKELLFSSPDSISGTITADVFIGSQRVIKDLPVYFSAIPGLDVSPLNVGNGNNFTSRLVTNLVIPPQVTFKMSLKVEPGALQLSNLRAAFKGVGVLFNPDISL